MTEEITEEHDPLTPETFSFLDVLEGREYPTDTVDLYFDEKSAYEVKKLLDRINSAAEGEDVNDLVDEAARLHDKVTSSIRTFHIRGVSDDEVTDLRDVAEERFKDRKKMVKAADGRLVPHLPEGEQLAYARFFNALVMSLHIEKVVDARGRVLENPDADEVAVFLDKAPQSQKAKLQAAINALRVDSSGFEAAVDADFLAKP